MKKIKYNDRLNIFIFSDQSKLYSHLSSSIANSINKGTCIMPGGNTPIKLYKLLSKNKKIKKNRKIILSDDRLVNNQDEMSNYKMVKKYLDINFHSNFNISYYDLINKFGLNETLKYISEKMLKECVECSLLGIGSDAHTASLFPDLTEILLNKELGLIIKNENENFKRFSLSFKTLMLSKKIIFIALGENKNLALDAVFGLEKNHLKYPVQKFFDEHPNIELYCDVESSTNFKH